MKPSLAEFERLYRDEYRRFVRVAAAITRDGDAAVEAVQEAFARAIKQRHDFRGAGPLQAWVWRVVVNEAKRRASPPPVLPLVPHEEQTNGVPHEDAAVRALIARLPERQRLAVFLRYYAELDYRTIGKVLEVETGTVSATLAAAHRSLRDAIEGVKS